MKLPALLEKAGTLIPTFLISGINSDAGQVVAQVRENVCGNYRTGSDAVADRADNRMTTAPVISVSS